MSLMPETKMNERIERCPMISLQIEPHVQRINALSNEMFYSDREGRIRWAVEQDDIGDASAYIGSILTTLKSLLTKGITDKSLDDLEGMVDYGGFFVDNQPLFLSSIFIEKTKVSKASINALNDEFLSVQRILHKNSR